MKPKQKKSKRSWTMWAVFPKYEWSNAKQDFIKTKDPEMTEILRRGDWKSRFADHLFYFKKVRVTEV